MESIDPVAKRVECDEDKLGKRTKAQPKGKKVKTAGSVLLVLCVLASTPALAQHMNAKGAPCQQPGSTVETGDCFVSAAKKSDAELNKEYNAIQSFLRSAKRTEDGDALRKAQRAWVAYRDANCGAARGLYGTGTGGYVTYWACMEANTRQRTEDLKTGFGWLLDK